MISKQDLLELVKKETALTMKALNAFPPNQNEFRPHERSSNALQLASTFVFEIYLAAAHVLGEPLDRSKFKTYKPDSVATAAKDFQRESEQFMERFAQMPESALSNEVEFAGVKFKAGDFLFMMMEDQIHHRGQLTVYIRMAGGKVPAIYGPSADDSSIKLN